MSEERKKFHYPPYSEHAIIRIQEEKKDKVTEIMSKITNKIDLLKTGDIFVSFDREITDKLRGEWLAKIILK
jgi:primosomal protein N'